ncbi:MULTISPECIES: tetratricopeptide repeat protein [unclassified Herbaspirillum]|uniref:tetratricopeptide repeat protein n=1 Tax=unclassified Herbaspirillum TaxID=2624150 RepID=UPI000E2E936E|nr:MULTISPECIES: tetratricopeptide repeat protein [unclassified Herbaspirillum]RFB68738.1 tetratricopeptide repeat protein [Herbaspirillum sp. 3R-3a1]TFI05815.1 tetratricopeptide repeat protein [Herbaspirillum sp. 3R11]TFI13666.1 tetratricopeptide repeat protein [Herbaspirillum sp. 3R-11]TFI21894.1 tetratricopeptide repeat protein [Herbaspirillum sp. 3C11]
MSTRSSNKPANKSAQPNVKDLLAVRECLSLLDDHKVDEAKVLCAQVLKRAPNLVYANHAWGLIAMHKNDYVTAEAALRKAVAADPKNSEYVANLATSVLNQDRIDDSIALYEEAIKLNSENKDARIGLANALHEKNDPDASIAYFEDAVKRNPDAPGPLSHLGKALIDAKQYKEAVGVLFKSLQLQINFAPAHTNLGIAFQEMDMLKDALECHKTSLLLDPTDIYAQNKIADTYIKQKDYDKANEHYRRVLELAPKDPNSYTKLASSLFTHQDRYEEAMALFHKALEVDPKHPITLNNVGATMYDYGETVSSLQYFKDALALKPNYLTAQHNLALGQLLAGDLKEGWANHESRLEVKERRYVYKLIHKLFGLIPKWDGKSSLKGKYILLMHEQGFGDSIQFVRYVHKLLEQGARVALHVKDPLARLFRSVSDQVTLVRENDPLPKCDCAYVLMSLPHALGTDHVEDIPSYPFYLSADPQDIKTWKDKMDMLAGNTDDLRVGFVWAGNPEHGNDRKRSIPLETFAPLFNTPGVQFFSIQKGLATPELEKLPKGLPVYNIGDAFNDFADTAAAMANLDLIISVDTSVVHLAGALGRPTWTLLAHTPDWRWLNDREDSPWYPSMRLFRQQTRNDWPTVIRKVASELAILAQAKKKTAV